ncbi:hypothetical protein KO525_07400 [Psychrosphaera sp. B3R10]|uniref:O-antigen ligase family protein n=1 Tax=unclassified Psychrosphaera TaxID=2641570 RepID=UPI001C08F7E6|nr:MULTISPECIES: O-antigen ligase family protein [unclassified Psychrosphaera]MBU2881834.1 hypothetical protein [Psychrosphaera sp. I2R16]MBU2989194.1 hypothetical protein [Psychrosphaera sp. B3R10]MDO6719990.1 O-antigen ligase family protein [Psychrosphaera sp. 1_MG-2023]
MLLLVSTLIIIIYNISRSYYSKGQQFVLLFFSTFYLVAPTAKIFGEKALPLNIPFSRFVMVAFIFCLLINVIVSMKIKWNRRSSKLITIVFLIFLSTLTTSLIRNSFNVSKLNFTALLNNLTFFFFLIASISVFDYQKRIKVDSSKLVLALTSFVLFFSSLLALLTFVSFEPVYYIHKSFYNIHLGGYDGDKSLFSMVELYNRVYSTFSGPNQFGLFAVLSFIFVNHCYAERKISRLYFVFSLIFCFIVLVTSQSRTSIVMFLLAITLLNTRSLKKGLKFIPFFLVVTLISLPFLPERVFNMFSAENFMDELDSQRIFFWLASYNEMTSSTSSLLLGFIEKITNSTEGFHIENGYLQLIAIGGLFPFILLIIFMAILNFHFKQIEVVSLRHAARISLLIVLLSEFLMGNIFNVKISTYIAILFAFYFTSTPQYNAYFSKLSSRLSVK